MTAIMDQKLEKAQKSKHFGLHKFYIELDETGHGKVEMDGKPLNGVHRVSFQSGVGEIPLIKLELSGEIVSNVVTGETK